MFIFGIMGGMGSMATVDLFSKIVQNTPAQLDQEHIRIKIDNYPQIPSRITAIMAGTESPLEKLKESAKGLEKAGVTTIAMACNTAHYWFEEVQESVGTPMIHLIDNATTHIKQCRPELSEKIMLLATSATVQTGLYQKSFSKEGLHIQIPDSKEQKNIAGAIEEIKAGHIHDNSYLEKLLRMMEGYSQEGIHAFIGGCTELPMLFPYLKGNFEKYDPTLLLAQEVVGQAMSYARRSE